MLSIATSFPCIPNPFPERLPIVLSLSAPSGGKGFGKCWEITQLSICCRFVIFQPWFDILTGTVIVL